MSFTIFELNFNYVIKKLIKSWPIPIARGAQTYLHAFILIQRFEVHAHIHKSIEFVYKHLSIDNGT